MPGVFRGGQWKKEGRKQTAIQNYMQTTCKFYLSSSLVKFLVLSFTIINEVRAIVPNLILTILQFVKLNPHPVPRVSLTVFHLGAFAYVMLSS